MRIAENTPERLVLKEETLWVSVLCGLAAGWLLVGGVPRTGWKAAAVAGFFLLFGFAFFRTARVTFDRAQQLALIEQRVVFRRTACTVPFKDIEDVLIDVSSAEHRGTAATRLLLATTAGAKPLAPMYTSGFAAHTRVRIAVLEFLGRPVSDVMEESLRYMLAHKQPIGAVELVRLRDKVDLKTALQRVKEMQKAMQDAAGPKTGS
jgi:hypothetical protein